MNNPTEQFLASAKSAVTDLTGFATTAFAGFEKLAEVNMAAAKSAFADAQTQAKAVLGVKSPEDLAALQSGGVQPLVEKAAAYGRSVYEIATETGAELTKATEGKLAEAQKTLTAGVEAVLKNAPQGSEAVVAVLKNAMTAGQNALETAQTSVQKVMEFAEKNVANVTAETVKSVKAATKAK